MKIATPFLLLIIAGCAPPQPISDDLAVSDGTEAAPRFRRRSDVIVERELAMSDAINLQDAIQQLRPRFLQRRGDSSLNRVEGTMVVVYIDDARAGTPDILRSIHPTEVREVQYLDGPSASARYGLNHGGGAVLVYRKRGGSQP